MPFDTSQEKQYDSVFDTHSDIPFVLLSSIHTTLKTYGFQTFPSPCGETTGNKASLKTANDSSSFWEFDATQANLFSLTPIHSDVWQHLGVTYDGLAMKLYFNGNLENTVAAAGSLNIDDNPVIIGGQNCTSNCRDPFLGIIDEVRIYNNALTQDEIQRDMSFDSTIPEPASILLLGSGLLGARKISRLKISSGF